MASEQLIRELMSALKDEYGKEVSFDEASRILADLVVSLMP
jgi:acyl carrier protein